MVRVVGINLGIFLALACVAELIFGDWISPRDFGALNLPRNSVRTFDVENLYGGGIITHTRDTHGLRGDYGTLENIDMLALGGSTTNELYVDDAKIWTAELQRNLRTHDPSWDIANAGAEGQSTVGHLYNFDVWFPNLQGLAPKYVIAYIGVNDVHVESQADHDAISSPDPMRNFAQWFKNKSAIYRLYKVVRGMMEARDAKVIHGGGQAARGPWQEIAPPALTVDDETQGRVQEYATRVGKLIERIEGFGAQAIIVTQSRSAYRVENGKLFVPTGTDGPVAKNGYITQSTFNAAAMQACQAKSNAVCIDLGRDLRFGDDDFYDWVHTTESGSIRIGRFLFGHLKDRISPKDQAPK